jgi:hypothetical protein
LRIRSTIIRFSARSFALSVSAARGRVVLRPEAAGPRALDRTRLDMARRIHLQEALGRRADDGHAWQVEERRER